MDLLRLAVHLRGQLLLRLRQTFLGELSAAVAVLDERPEVLARLKREIAGPGRSDKSTYMLGIHDYVNRTISYVDVVEVVLLLGLPLVVRPQRKLVDVGTLAKVHALVRKEDEGSSTFGERGPTVVGTSYTIPWTAGSREGSKSTDRTCTPEDP